MAIELRNVYKESLPASRLIGTRYLDSDRFQGGFGHKWGEWFGSGRFAALEALGPLPENGASYLGAMRMAGDVPEYWIGMLFPQDTPVPEGFDHTDVDALDLLTCWVYGSQQSGELYGMDIYNLCAAEAARQGIAPRQDGWVFERYNCPRFTSPDEKGNVILDYCITVG